MNGTSRERTREGCVPTAQGGPQCPAATMRINGAASIRDAWGQPPRFLQASSLLNADARELRPLFTALTVDCALLCSVFSCGASAASAVAVCVTLAPAGSCAAADFADVVVACTWPTNWSSCVFAA